jgi:hypothetical protein
MKFSLGRSPTVDPFLACPAKDGMGLTKKLAQIEVE